MRKEQKLTIQELPATEPADELGTLTRSNVHLFARGGFVRPATKAELEAASQYGLIKAQLQTIFEQEV
jgi:hypothetical protein